MWEGKKELPPSFSKNKKNQKFKKFKIKKRNKNKNFHSLVAADECVGRVVCVCVQEIRSVSMETSPFSPLTENKKKK
jgi:hypothetical protein